MNSARPPTTLFFSASLTVLMTVGLMAWPECALLDESVAWAAPKPKPAQRKEPELKIIDVNIKPVPYVPQQGPLEFGIALDLPPDVERSALLEVTALISSPSRSSLRFLSYRHPIGPLLTASHRSHVPVVKASTAIEKGPSPRVRITLGWDGKDHTKQEVSAGTYQYELRAKVIAGGDNTPRTLTVSWPKRGTLTVK